MTEKDHPKMSAEKIRALIDLNPDARQYFFTKADEKWLAWLWANGLLDEIKKKAPDPTRHGYRMPELQYLGNVADKDPAGVVDIMLQVPSTSDAFNPEVIDRFLWICSKLPADQLARIVPKVHDENWIKMMSIFNDPGFEYEKMLTTLSSAKDYDNLVLLSEAILSVRTKEEVGEATRRWGDNPFYMDTLSYTKVFEHLLAVDAPYVEGAFAVAVKALGETTLLGRENEEDRVFRFDETYHLFDVDFFTLRPGQGEHYSPRDEVRELAAAAKALAERLMNKKCEDESFIRRIFDQYIKPLPESRTIWRFQLYAYSLCPKTFAMAIREQIFRIFKYETPGDIISGAEYERFLQATFGVLSDADKREYVTKIIEWFTKKDGWEPSGRDLLSCAVPFLTPDEKALAEKSFGPLKQDYVPQTTIGATYAGTVIPQPPPNTDDEWKKSVPEIVELLKTEWSPETLKEKYKKEEDFLRPIDAEGVAERLKSEMVFRQEEFMKNAPLFFDREKLDSHYTYAFLQKIYDLIREKKTAEGLDFAGVFSLMEAIAESGIKDPFGEAPASRKGWGWLAYWEAVHDAMADILKEMLGGGEKPIIQFDVNRATCLSLIGYLLGHPDPALEDEVLETAKSTTGMKGEKGAMVSDPFTIAINSVRGRAFQALVNFTYRDAQIMPKDQSVKLAPEVKKLYEETLAEEKTRAIMFMFGHYMPSFYFRDKEWMRGLLPQIFPTDRAKEYLYLAAWEGYLSGNLYQEMFFDPDIQKLYERGIALKDSDDETRKHFKDPDEGIAVHLGLAFMYYEEFGFEHPLFKAFWATRSDRHGDFVSFLGRMFVSGDNANANELLEKQPRVKERLKAFWDWVLAQYQDPKLFFEFGFWVNLKKDVFEAQWLAERTQKTLEKTNGFLDWDHGLLQSIVLFAKVAPVEALAIARLHLLEGGVRARQDQRHMPIYIEGEWFEAFKILYATDATKAETETLINNLIHDGGSSFWKLREILR